MEIFARLDPASVAFLLDVDGTLIDIGPSPTEVEVPETLKAALAALHVRSGGALALISGRPIRDLDRLFAPLRLPAVGGHGAELRLTDDTVSRIDDLPSDLRRHLLDAVTPGSGIEYEDKGYSVALHYRKAPQHEERLRAHVAGSQAAFPAVDTEVLPGKAVFEIKRAGTNKGDGVRGVMAHAPFAGRQPVFIGDDVTDAAAFAALAEFGGQGFSVGCRFDGVSGVFESPEQVRLALRRLAHA
ncbi:MAG: trehalose-phosphatase [Pseudolabrys sp.]|nr:trehalose-phosphatase [Pseudolabrys sp.]MDP2296751.1 trehalose-phosphatase [Pseudolabrys sp.]